MVSGAGKGREEGVEVVHADPRVGVRYGEERGSLERLRENLNVGGGRDGSIRVEVVGVDLDLRMSCRL